MTRKFLAATATLLLAATAARADDAYDIAAWAPADSVTVFAWSGADAALPAFQKSRLGQFWARPSISEFFTTPARSGWRLLRREAGKQIGTAHFDLISQALAQCWHQPGMIAVFPVKADDEWPVPLAGALIWKTGPDSARLADDLKKWIADQSGADLKDEEIAGIKFTALTPDLPLYFAAQKDRWIVAYSKAAAKHIAGVSRGRSFADNPVHKRAREALGSITPYYYSCTDVVSARSAIFDVIEAAAGHQAPAHIVLPALNSRDGTTIAPPQDSGDDDENLHPQKTAHKDDPRSQIEIAQQRAGMLAGGLTAAIVMRSVLGGGLLGSGEFASASGFDGPYMYSVSCARADSAHPLLIDYTNASRVDRKWLDEKPADAVSYDVSTLEPSKMFTSTLHTADWYVTQLMSRVPEIKRDPPPADLLKYINEQAGMDIDKEILRHLGPHWVTYMRPGLLSIAIAIEVRDSDAIKTQIDKLLAALPRDVKFKNRKINGTTLHLVDFSANGPMPIPFSPCWALAKDRFIIALDASAARQLILASQPSKNADEDSADSPPARPKKSTAIAEFLAAHKEEKTTSIRWRDEEALFTPMYGQLSLFYPMLTNAIENEQPRMKFAPLPGMKDFTGFMSETVSWTTVAGPVRIQHDRTSIPMISASLDPGAAALGISILLPSLSRARELSKRTVCASNLRGLGQANYIYAQDHNDKFAPNFEALLKANNITEKQCCCPSSDALPGQLHACYEYIPGQGTADDPTRVLIYEKKGCHQNEGGNVLFIDGHVEFIKPYARVEELVKKTQDDIAEETKKKSRDK